MAKRRIEDIVTELVMPVIEENAFELVEVEYLKEGANWYLRVYIDKPGGIGIDDCQVVSERLSDLLDETDPVKESYILEVSSPGLERPLKKDTDFIKYRGQEVEVKLFKPLNGKKVYEGELVGLFEGKVVIKQKDIELSFDRTETAMVKRVLKFGKTGG